MKIAHETLIHSNKNVNYNIKQKNYIWHRITAAQEKKFVYCVLV